MDSSENSTTLLECRLILTGPPSLLWTPSHLTGLSAPVSTGHSRHPSPTAFLELLFPTLWPAFSSYFRSPEISSPKPFVWFRAKTDKGIVCLADHLHSVTVVVGRKKEGFKAESTTLGEQREKHVIRIKRESRHRLRMFFLYFLVVLKYLFVCFVFTV